MKRIFGVLLLVVLATLTLACNTSSFKGTSNQPFWSQWGANSEHSGMVPTVAQGLSQQLADITYDPFTPQELAENQAAFGVSALLVHYPAPLVDGPDVYMLAESGTYTSCNPVGAWAQYPFPACGPNAWNSKTWGEARYTWQRTGLNLVWTFNSDWKPEPSGFGLFGWEPVFHAAEANGFLYVPGAGGTLWKVNKSDGSSTSHINPFTGLPVVAQNTYVSSPLAADANGNVFYNVVQLADPSLGDPWVQNDVVGAWLVKVDSSDKASTVSYQTLTPDAPAGSSQNCPGTFLLLFDNGASLPWPPTQNAVPPTQSCGSQRPGINIAPAVAPDGTIYTASVAHFDSQVTYLIAVHPDLSLKWSSPLQNILNDGCGVEVPIGPTNTSPNACRVGTTFGVDPNTNAKGSGWIYDYTSSSPSVLPDGAVLFPAAGGYGNGHLFKFDASGHFLASYEWGYDTTPAIYSHDNTYSIIIKDDVHAPVYCPYLNPLCPPVTPQFYMTQLSADLLPEWQFQNTNTESCTRQPDGTLSCVSDHPNGFEWCVNAAAIDKNGTVYANSEDGFLYAIPQGNTGIFTQPADKTFLQRSLAAAYTPLSMGPDGKIYAENAGHVFVIGNLGP
jgi:hypothetical protein